MNPIGNALAIIDKKAGKLFAAECGIRHPVEFAGSTIRIWTDSLASAKRLYGCKYTILGVKCREWGQDGVEIYWINSCGLLKHFFVESQSAINPKELEDSSMVSLSGNLKSRLGNGNILVVPELDLDFNALYFNENPVYISDLTDGSLLFANPTALQAQQKSLPDLQRTSAAIDNPEDIASRNKLLCEPGGTGRLTDFEYKAYRWFKDENGIYRLKEMNFVSFFARVPLFNTDCRLAVTLQAEPTGRIL